MKREFPPYVTYVFVSLMSVAVLCMQATLPFLMAKTFHRGYDAVGLLIMWASFWYVVAGLSLGKLSHRLGPRRVMLATLAVAALMTVTLALVTSQWQMWQVYLVVTLHFMAVCIYWSSTEHATTGLHQRLSLIQSTLIFCIAFSVGNCLGVMASGYLQSATSLVLPFTFSAAMLLVVMALVWWMVPPKAGLHQENGEVAPALPEEARARLKRLLIGTRPGLVAVYGAYALVTFFVPRYLWQQFQHTQFQYTEGQAGLLASSMFIVTASTYGVLLVLRNWTHKLWAVRAGPFVAACGLLVISASANPFIVFAGIFLVGIAAATVYAHNLCYSLEDPSQRGRNAGIHEALVGAAYMLPPALSGLAARWIEPRSMFWVGAGLAILIAIGQNIALALHTKRAEKRG